VRESVDLHSGSDGMRIYICIYSCNDNHTKCPKPITISGYQSLQVTSTSSVLYRCVTVLSEILVVCPVLNPNNPACAIIIPLSIQNLSSVAYTSGPGMVVTAQGGWVRNLLPQCAVFNAPLDVGRVIMSRGR